MTQEKELKVVQFKANQIIFNEGDDGYFFYIIQEGQIEVFRRGRDGKEIVVGNVEKGQPLGEFALLTNNKRSASARAITDGSAIEVSENAYRKLISELPDWSVAVLESLIDRLNRANEMLLKDRGNAEVTLDKIDEVINKISF